MAAGGARRAAGAGRPRTASSASTPAARTTAPTCSTRPSPTSSSRSPADVVPRRRPPRPGAAPPSCRVGLAPPRRRQPRARRAGRAAGRGRRRPRRPTCSAPSCASGPRCAGCSRWASRSPAPAAARPASSAASTTRASTTTSAAVLAVNTAGMLVRRSVLDDLGGFDDQLPVFGNDIDFGWRAAAAGHRTIVVPAGGRVPRRGRPPRRPAHAADRAAHPLPGAPGRALHAAGQHPRPGAARGRSCGSASGTLLRVLGLPAGALGRRGARRAGRAGLALRQPRPDRRAARRDRTRRAQRDPATSAAAGALVGALPARPRLRQRPRRGRDQPGPGRRRAPPGGRRGGRGRGHPVSPPARRRPSDEDEGPAERHRAGRPVPHQPGGRSASRVFVLLVLVGAREAFGPVSRRRAVRRHPTGARDRWRLYAESWHPLGQGTAVPAPAYVLPLAMLGLGPGRQRGRRGRRRSCCSPCRWRCGAPGGSCAWSAGCVDAGGAPRWLLAVAAATYALVPVVSGAWGDGRLGVVVAAATAALAGACRPRLRRPRARPALAGRLAHRAAAGARSRRSRRCAWFFAAALGVVVVGVAFVIVPAPDAGPLGLGAARRRRSASCPCCCRRGGCPRCWHGAGRQPAARHRPAARPAARLPRPADRPARRRPRRARGGSASCWS